MTLSEYFEAQGRGSRARVARESGVRYPTLWRIAKRGIRLADFEKAKAVVDACGGDVPLSEVWGPASRGIEVPQ